jgi:hypothetical protein
LSKNGRAGAGGDDGLQAHGPQRGYAVLPDPLVGAAHRTDRAGAEILPRCPFDDGLGVAQVLTRDEPRLRTEGCPGSAPVLRHHNVPVLDEESPGPGPLAALAAILRDDDRVATLARGPEDRHSQARAVEAVDILRSLDDRTRRLGGLGAQVGGNQ